MALQNESGSVSTEVITAVMTGSVKTSRMAILVIPELSDNGNGTFTWTGRSTLQWKGLCVKEPQEAVAVILRRAAEAVT